VDAATHHVTLELPDGSKRTVSVNPGIDLRKVAPGDAVTCKSTTRWPLQWRNRSQV